MATPPTAAATAPAPAPAAGAFSWDDLLPGLTTGGGAGTVVPPAVCLSCLRVWQLNRPREACPSCGVPTRPITPEQAAVIHRSQSREWAAAVAAMHAAPAPTPTRGSGGSTLPMFDLSALTTLFGGGDDDGTAEFDTSLLAALADALASGGGSGGGGGAGGGSGDAVPATPAAIAGLKRVVVADVLRDLPHHTVLRVTVGPAARDPPPPRVGRWVNSGVAELVGVPATFGPRPPAPAALAALPPAPLVAATPATGPPPGTAHWDAPAAARLRGALVLMDRGAITFARKALAANAAGAVGVVVVQSEAGAAAGEWPLRMADASGECVAAAASGTPLTIPAVMVSASDGASLRSLLAWAAAADAPVTASLASLPKAEACPICMEGFDAGTTATFMPCQHVFHDGCLVPWLARQHRCPLCRFELPSDHAEAAERAAAARARRLEAERTAVAESWYG